MEKTLIFWNKNKNKYDYTTAIDYTMQFKQVEPILITNSVDVLFDTLKKLGWSPK